MKPRTVKVTTLAFVALFVALYPLSALAADETATTQPTDGSTTTTIDSGLVPAVEVGGDEPAAAEVDWTYRYLIPTGLALAVVIILITSVKYFTDVVRKRYRIVD